MGWFRNFTTITNITFADTANGSYGSTLQFVALSGSTYGIGLAAFFGCAAGANTVTATWVGTGSGGDGIIAIIEEPASAGVRNSASTQGSTSSTVEVSLSGTVSGDVVVGYQTNTNGTNPSTGTIGGSSGYAQTNPYPDVSFAFDGTSPGGTVLVSSVITASQWAQIAIALKPATVATIVDESSGITYVDFGAAVRSSVMASWPYPSQDELPIAGAQILDGDSSPIPWMSLGVLSWPTIPAEELPPQTTALDEPSGAPPAMALDAPRLDADPPDESEVLAYLSDDQAGPATYAPDAPAQQASSTEEAPALGPIVAPDDAPAPVSTFADVTPWRSTSDDDRLPIVAEDAAAASSSPFTDVPAQTSPAADDLPPQPTVIDVEPAPAMGPSFDAPIAAPSYADEIPPPGAATLDEPSPAVQWSPAVVMPAAPSAADELVPATSLVAPDDAPVPLATPPALAPIVLPSVDEIVAQVVLDEPFSLPPAATFDAPPSAFASPDDALTPTALDDPPAATPAPVAYAAPTHSTPADDALSPPALDEPTSPATSVIHSVAWSYAYRDDELRIVPLPALDDGNAPIQLDIFQPAWWTVSVSDDGFVSITPIICARGSTTPVPSPEGATLSQPTPEGQTTSCTP